MGCLLTNKYGLSVGVCTNRNVSAEEPKWITEGTKRGHKRNFTGTKQVHLIGRAGYKMFANQTVVFGHPKNYNAKRTWAKFASPKGDILT